MKAQNHTKRQTRQKNSRIMTPLKWCCVILLCGVSAFEEFIYVFNFIYFYIWCSQVLFIYGHIFNCLSFVLKLNTGRLLYLYILIIRDINRWLSMSKQSYRQSGCKGLVVSCCSTIYSPLSLLFDNV